MQFYPNFALFSTLGGMNLDQDFFPVSKLSEDQKKKGFTRNGTLFFFPNSSTDLRSDAHQSQIIKGGADKDHTQLLGGIQSKYWGGYIPPSTVSAPLSLARHIDKGVLIRQIITSHLCTAIDCLQFRKESRKL